MKQGFTLIELMVVIFIVILLVSGSIMGISASRNRRQAKTTAEKLKYYLTEARAMATTPDDMSFGLRYIQFHIYQNPNKVKLYKVMVDATITEITSLKFDIPKGVTITPLANFTSSNNCGGAGTPNCDRFSFSAARVVITDPPIGQAIGQNPSANISMQITDGNENYKLEINAITGLMTITQI